MVHDLDLKVTECCGGGTLWELVLYKTLNQYLIIVQVSKESMYGLRRYGSLIKTFNVDNSANIKRIQPWVKKIWVLKKI